MGANGSKPEDIAALASSPVAYSPPLGPPNPVSRFIMALVGAPAAGTGSGAYHHPACRRPPPDAASRPPLQANPVVYFDIKLGRYGAGTPLGRIEIELKADVTPLTAENFLQLVRSLAAKSCATLVLVGSSASNAVAKS